MRIDILSNNPQELSRVKIAKALDWDIYDNRLRWLLTDMAEERIALRVRKWEQKTKQDYWETHFIGLHIDEKSLEFVLTLWTAPSD